MADQEEAFGLQNSPNGSEPREVQGESKPESKQNSTASKSPSSQTTYIQQVSGVQLGVVCLRLDVLLVHAAFTDLQGQTHVQKC